MTTDPMDLPIRGQPPSEVEILRAQVKLMRECHEQADSILRSAMSIAERDGRETNWPAFREQLRFTLDTYYVARQAFASADSNQPTR